MNKNINWFYEFDAKEKINKDNGETVTNIKKLAILKPNRRLREDGELFYAAETSRFARAGVLPKAAWGTILSNGGGSISEKEREVYGTLLLKFRDCSFELQTILIKPETERSDIEKKRSDELISELDDIRKDIQGFEASQLSIFENTAEAKARNRTILWWVLNLSYMQNEQNEFVPLFNGSSFEDKLNSYDIYEETQKEDSFILGVIRRLTYLITLWFLGRAESKEEFADFDSNFILENSIPDEPESSSSSSSEEKVVEKTVIKETVIEETVTKEVPASQENKPAEQVSETVQPS
jgi:hypothetical protein